MIWRPLTSMAPELISSCRVREKYSGVTERRDAMMLFFAGRVTASEADVPPVAQASR